MKSALPPIYLKGVLVENAELRNRVVDGEGHFMPCICFTMRAAETGLIVRVEWPQHRVTHQGAEFIASRMHKGLEVSLQAPLREAKLMLVNAADVHFHPDLESPCKH